MDNKEKLNEIIKVIKEHSKNTKLYEDMIKRNGKFIIHKGSIRPDVLFIGEAGGKDEDIQGQPFVGRSGKLLDEWIQHCKLINNKNIAVINCVPIMPTTPEGKIRKPTDQEITFFRPFFQELVDILKPKITILLGRSAEKAFFEQNGLLQNTEWYYNTGFIYHPSYYLRNGRKGIKDFEKLMRKKRKW